MNKKALLITYYWPPAGGPGVHRWLRFSNYFTENGWDLTVYCPDNAAWPVVDEKLLEEVPSTVTVIRQPIFEPHKFFQKKAGFTGGAGLGSTTKKGWLKQLMIWVRGNLFIPDARRFWINPSYRFLKNYLNEHPEITHVISTGPPHSMHVIAKKLKEIHPNIKWVADFRDPWTEIDYYQELNIGKRADNKQKKLEKEVLSKADLVISIGNDCAAGLEKIGGRKVEIITNGFIFPEFDEKQVELDKKFTISHFGSMAPSRNPLVLWQALEQLIQENSDFANHLQIQLYGTVDFSIIKSIEEHGLAHYLAPIQQMSHAESIVKQRKSQLLLLIANQTANTKGILTGKFFEYLGAKRPILAIGQKESDLENIINETESGFFVGYEDVESAKNCIQTYFKAFLNKNLFVESKNTAQFHSGVIATKMLLLLEDIK